jgi:asparagine synthase (glutamine-hydrolysing)
VCGIAGVVGFDGRLVDRSTIQRMIDTIAHRGPDGEGVWTEGPIGIGHRRLAILDPSPAGAQPMIDPPGRFVLSYNGEVYNFRELRVSLERQGYRFTTGTDTEVVLHALACWGTEALGRFNGMFALALWDRVERRLLLARDRYGIKPLYYSTTDHRVVFASEQRAIRASPHHVPRLDLEAVIEYFTFQNLFTDRTFDQGIQMLSPGTFLEIELHGTRVASSTTRYWDYRFEDPEKPGDNREYSEELDRLFVQAVERNLVSDVEVGSYLSGGIDSGSITAVAAGYIRNMKTFTCGFNLDSITGLETAFDEREAAEAAAAAFGTEHSEIVLKAGDMERALPEVVSHIEEPRVGQSYPNYYAASLASRFVKVVLSGTGGDEMFGGYPWRYYRAASSESFEEYLDHYYAYWQRFLPNNRLQALFAPISTETRHVSTRDIFREVFPSELRAAETPQDYVNRSLYFEARTFLHGLLTVEDKLSMAHGLETRVPFLDNDLVSFAMSCPVDLKVKNVDHAFRLDENSAGNKPERFFSRTADGKAILRDAMARHLPDPVREAVKRGFSGPDASWFRGESIEFVRRRLFNPSSRIAEVVDVGEMQSVLEEHFSGEHNHRLLVWSLLVFDEILETQF